MKQRQDNAGQSEMLRLGIHVLKNHGRSVFLTALLTAIAGIVIISLVPDKYEATTTILVDPQKIPERYVASTITSDPNAHLNTLTQQVLSASRLQEIVDKLNPYPELQRRMSHEELLDYIRSKIKIELKPGSEQALSSFSISYIDKNRWLVAPVANQLAASFIDWNLRARQQQALVTTQFLSNELEKAQQSLQEQEAALENFRMQHAGATPDQLDANLQALSRLQAEVQSHVDAISRLDEERLLISHDSHEQPTEKRDPSTLGERDRLLQERNRLEVELQALRHQYTETYPDVVSVKAQLVEINSRLSALPAASPTSPDAYDSPTRLRLDLINKDIQRHKEQVGTIQQEIAGYQHKVQTVPILETQLAELTRNYETSRQNYQSLLDKRLSAGMSEDLERRQQAERFTVLDPARAPEKPVQPKRLPLMAGAVAFAMVAPAALFIFVHLSGGAIHSETDLLTLIPARSRILATIPPVVSIADTRRSRMRSVQAVLISFVACAALILFLIKVRPVL